MIRTHNFLMLYLMEVIEDCQLQYRDDAGKSRFLTSGIRK